MRFRYTDANGRQHSVADFAQLQELIRSGSIQATTPLFDEHKGFWLPAGSHEAFREARRPWFLRRPGQIMTLCAAALAAVLVYPSVPGDEAMSGAEAGLGSLVVAAVVLAWSRRTRPYVPVTALGLILLASFGERLEESERDELGARAGAEEVSVVDLRVGVCFDDPPALLATQDIAGASDGPVEVETVMAVPCVEPHDNEIYHEFDLEDGAFRGDAALEEEADAGCLDAFETFVGREYFESELAFLSLRPTARSWVLGDRRALCIVYDMDLAKLIGTMRGSGR